MRPDWRQLSIYVAVLGTELCWLYVLLAMLDAKLAGGALSVPWLLLLYPVAFGLGLALKGLGGPGLLKPVIGWLAWVTALLLSVKFQLYGGAAWGDAAWLLAIPRAFANILYAFGPSLLLLLTSGLLWWLGRRLAGSSLDFAGTLSRFQFGLVVLLAALFAAAEFGLETAGSLAVTLAFFIFALAGLSLSHAREGSGWLAGLYRGQWSGLLLVSIVVILLVGLLIGAVLTADLLQYVVDGLKWLWGVFTQLLAWVASLLPQPEPSELPPLTPPPDTITTPDESSPILHLPDWLRRTVEGGWGILWFGLILVAVWRVTTDVFRWLRRRFPGRGGAEYESMKGAFRMDLLNFLRKIVRWLVKLRPSFLYGRKPVAATPEAATVRELYRRFLHWAAGGGHPRQPQQTPLEYARALAEILPQARQELAFITTEYVSARYGALSYNIDELALLRESWRRLKQQDLKHIKPGPAAAAEGDTDGQTS